MLTEIKSYTARWVLTAAGPPLENGILVARDDKIEAVEPAGSRKADVDLGNVALIPGLVNAHTHLDLSGARGLIPPTDPEHFTDWLKSVIAYRKTRTAEQVQQDIRAGLAECLKAGTTLVGDITSGGASMREVSRAAIRSILFWELLGLSEEKYDIALAEFDKKPTVLYFGKDPTNRFFENRNCLWWLSPHAPYSANHRRTWASLFGNAAIHLAESPGEVELLRYRTGPFVSFLKQLNLWDEKEFTMLPEDFVFVWDQSNCSQIFAHCNYLNTETSFGIRQSICYCPRTHAAFGHPAHPFREFMKRGVRVCLGTDSLASNPDLDILAEARFVKHRYPDLDGKTLLKMVTLFGAEALGWADECGSLEAGKSADAVVVPLPDCDGDPYELLFANDTDGERKTMFRGEWRNL